MTHSMIGAQSAETPATPTKTTAMTGHQTGL